MSNTQQLRELKSKLSGIKAIISLADQQIEEILSVIPSLTANDRFLSKQEMLQASWNETIEIIETNPLFGWVIDDFDSVGPDWQDFKDHVGWASRYSHEYEDIGIREALIDEALHNCLEARVGTWIHPKWRDNVELKLKPKEWRSTEIAIVPMSSLAEAQFVFDTLVKLYELTLALAEPLDPIH